MRKALLVLAVALLVVFVAVFRPRTSSYAASSGVTVDNSVANGAAIGTVIDDSGWPVVLVSVQNEHGYWTKIDVFDNFNNVKVTPDNVWASSGYLPGDAEARYKLEFHRSFDSRVQFFINAARSHNEKPSASVVTLVFRAVDTITTAVGGTKVEHASLEALQFLVDQMHNLPDCMDAGDKLVAGNYWGFITKFRECLTEDQHAEILVAIAGKFGANVSKDTLLRVIFTPLRVLELVQDVWELLWTIFKGDYAGSVVFHSDVTASSNPPPVVTPAPPPPPAPVIRSDAAAFLSDVTLPDGTIISPGQLLQKTWRMKNTGTTTWGAGYQLVFRGGHLMGGPTAINVPVASPGHVVDITVPLQVPSTIAAGTYRGDWQLRNAQGTYFEPGIFFSLVVPGSQPSSGNATNVELVGVNVPSSLSPSRQFRPEVTVRVTSGRLSELQGHLLRPVPGTTNYSSFPHVAVHGSADSGQTYTFRFYPDYPMVAPNSAGTYDSVWRVWANNGWVGPEIHIRFNVYQANDSRPPNAPSLTSPNDWAVLVGQAPTLCAQPNGDPDGDAVTEYRFVIFESAQNYDSGWQSNNCVTPQGLGYYTYQWHAQVRDSHGSESGWSETRHFTLESSTISVTKLDFDPASPSNASPIVISVETSGCGGVNVGGKVLVNTASDGSANGEWRKIKDIGPKTNAEDAPRWDTLEYQEGTHLVRAEMTSCDGTVVVQHKPYTLLRGRPSRPFSLSPTHRFWSNSRTITFRWKPSMRANNYTLVVATSEDFTQNTILSVDVNGTEYTTTFDQDYTRLYWKVSANNEHGGTEEAVWWVGIDRTAPSSTIDTTQTPELSYETQFAVFWDGSDNASEIQSYDIQVRLEPGGQWTDWLAAHPHRSAVYQGQAGQTYCFRSRARDVAGNVEAYPDSPDVCVRVDPTQRPAEPWWAFAYVSKRNLVVVNRMVDVAIPAGYPIHLHFDESTTPTAADIYNASATATKGDDVRLVYNNQTEIPRHIVNFSSSAIDVWFATQSEIPANESSQAYALYYGNADAGVPPAEITAVYAPRIEDQTSALWHFEEISGDTPDATGQGHTIAWVNNPSRSLANGRHGRGIGLNGDQWGTVSPINGDHLTVEGWVWFDSLTNPSMAAHDWTGLIGSYDSRDNHNRWRITLSGYNGSTAELHADLETVDAEGHTRETFVFWNGRIEPNRWYHVALTYDGGTIRLWVNGEVGGYANVAGRIDSRMDVIYVGRNRPQHPPMVGRIDGFRVSSVARTSFPYGKVTVTPSVGVGQQLGQEVIGPADLVLQDLEMLPNPDGDLLVQATFQNVGEFQTYNEFYVHLYKDQVPESSGDLDGSTGFWVNAPVLPGDTVTLTTVVSDSVPAAFALASSRPVEQVFHLAAQVDSTGVVNETDNANNILSGLEVCQASPDAYEDDDARSRSRALRIGQTQSRNAHVLGDKDWVKFQADGGKEYLLRTANLGIAADPYLYLYGTDGTTLLTSNDDHEGTLASQITWQAPATGTYYARVQHWNPNVGGCGTSYELSVSEVLPPTPTPTATNTTLPTATSTASPPTPTGTQTATSTATLTARPTGTNTATPPRTASSTATQLPLPTFTASPVPTNAATASVPPSAAPTYTATPGSTPSATSSRTATPRPTGTLVPTETLIPASTGTPTPLPSGTATSPRETATRTATAMVTRAPTHVPSPTVGLTATPWATLWPGRKPLFLPIVLK